MINVCWCLYARMFVSAWVRVCEWECVSESIGVSESVGVCERECVHLWVWVCVFAYVYGSLSVYGWIFFSPKTQQSVTFFEKNCYVDFIYIELFTKII